VTDLDVCNSACNIYLPYRVSMEDASLVWALSVLSLEPRPAGYQSKPESENQCQCHLITKVKVEKMKCL